MTEATEHYIFHNCPFGGYKQWCFNNSEYFQCHIQGSKHQFLLKAFLKEWINVKQRKGKYKMSLEDLIYARKQGSISGMVGSCQKKTWKLA